MSEQTEQPGQQSNEPEPPTTAVGHILKSNGVTEVTFQRIAKNKWVNADALCLFPGDVIDLGGVHFHLKAYHPRGVFQVSQLRLDGADTSADRRDPGVWD